MLWANYVLNENEIINDLVAYCVSTSVTSSPSSSDSHQLDVTPLKQDPDTPSCFVTSFIMIANYYGANIEHKDIWVKDYVDLGSGNFTNPSGAAEKYGLNYSPVTELSESDVWEKTKASIDEGQPIIIQLRGIDPNQNRTRSHFVVGIGYNGHGLVEEDIIIIDPMYGEIRTLDKAFRSNIYKATSVRYFN